jgi:predicted TIM-barrel fold metal-dependent hydrolase
MATVVDFHVHVFPNNLEKWASKVRIGVLAETLSAQRLNQVRRRARAWMKPVVGTLHGLQTTLRYLPEFARRNVDEISGLAPIPSLFVESTSDDLIEAMDEVGVDFAVVIAHPPFISNDFIMETCEQNSRLIPVVNIPKGTPKPGTLLKSYAKQGAKILKIHAAADGEGPDSPRYRALIRTASDLGMPVIIHTGCIHTHLHYKNPAQGKAEIFSKWYETYSNTKFILAHMNYHEPHTALDLCEEYPNLLVDTSWQPAEMIGEAARRIGAERVFFGTDWPLVGNNISVGRKRIQDCVDTGLLNEEQSKLILGENAVHLLGLSVNAD